MSCCTITRHFRFDAGHRIVGHESHCGYLHGHSYSVDLQVSAAELDSIGRVIDFGVVKQVVGGWIDANLDHNMMFNSRDPLLTLMTSSDNNGSIRPFYLFKDENPTAENIAKHLFHVSQRLLDPFKIKVVHIRVYETPNCWADYEVQ